MSSISEFDQMWSFLSPFTPEVPNVTLEVPNVLKCGRCYDIAIDPIVPASASTEGKTEMICKHFLCRACVKTSDEIQCPHDRIKYQETLPDEKTATTIKGFVEKHPHVFNNKSYDKLVEERQSSIPIVIQIHKAIEQRNFDKIRDIVNQIKDEREKSRVLFNMLAKQIEKGNIEVAGKTLVSLMPKKDLILLDRKIPSVRKASPSLREGDIRTGIINSLDTLKALILAELGKRYAIQAKRLELQIKILKILYSVLVPFLVYIIFIQQKTILTQLRKLYWNNTE